MRILLKLFLICILANQILTRSLKHKSVEGMERDNREDHDRRGHPDDGYDGGNGGDNYPGNGSDINRTGNGDDGLDKGGEADGVDQIKEEELSDNSNQIKQESHKRGHPDQVDSCIEHECAHDIEKCFGDSDCLQIFERCVWLQYTHVHNLEEGRECVHEHPDAENLFHCITHDCLGIKDPETLVRFTQRHH